ncbi:MAG: GAF domain-containing protein [Myxococcaceae bacterium]|nr:GAF domain-containing protein [Myxococcaceae bacterium]
MRERIDALEGIERDWAAYDGEVLSGADDPTLQTIVSELAAELEVPIAMVSLVLRRTQLFRAHVGLSGELERLHATDRDVSFCQFVVRDGQRFEVNDAQTDDRVPQTLVRTLGVRAYLGFPLKVGDVIVGSLCGVDTRARSFTDAQKVRLAALAAQAQARLAELGRAPRAPAPVVASAMQPAIAELRNVVAPLVSGVPAARVASEELKVALRARGALPEWATRTAEAASDLGEILGEMADATNRLRPILQAVQRTVGEATRATTAEETVHLAVEIARHHLRHVGGVSLGRVPGDALKAPVGVAVSAAAALLSSLGLALQNAGRRSGVNVLAERSGEVVAIRFSADVPADVLKRCADEVAVHFPQGDPAISASGSALSLVFALG